jgi:hypothetical protein
MGKRDDLIVRVDRSRPHGIKTSLVRLGPSLFQAGTTFTGNLTVAPGSRAS